MISVLDQLIEPKKTFPGRPSLFSNAALWAMIVPLLIEQLLQVVVGLADTLMVSYAGEATVSGVSLDTMIYTIFIYLFTAVATGGAVVVSQYLGSGDKENADLAASQMFHINTMLSAVCTMIMLLLGNRVLSRLYGSVEPAVMGLLPMLIFSILFYNVHSISKRNHKIRNTLFVYLPAAVCLTCALFWILLNIRMGL